MLDILECVGREFYRRKGRFLGNVLGYVLAVGLMVFLVHFLFFVREAEDRLLKQTGATFLAFIPAKADDLVGSPTEVLQPLDRVNEGFIANTILTRVMHLEKFQEIRRLPHVRNAFPYLLYRLKSPVDGHFFTVGGFGSPEVGTAVPDDSNKGFLKDSCCPAGVFLPIKGATASGPAATEELLSGRPIERSGEIVLEESYAVNRNIPTGASMTLSGLSFPVVGVIKPGIRPAKADVYMTWEDAEKVINPRLSAPLNGQFNLVLVEVDDVEYQKAAIADVKRVLNGSVVTTYNCFKASEKVMGINQGAIWLLIVFMSLGATLLSLKSQMSSVLERKRDIGILKAIGWRDREISLQLLLESFLQALAGGLLGCLIGGILFVLVPVKDIAGVNLDVDPRLMIWVFLLGLGVAIIGGLTAGVFPALLASRQSPADAMRRL